MLAWGITPVGCTRFCEQPTLHHVGGTKDPDLDEIVRLGPDVVFVDTEENRKPDADALEAAGLRLAVTEVRAVADVEPMLRSMAEVLELDIEIAAVPQVEPMSPRTVFVPIWKRPWMTMNANTFGSSMLEAVGLVNVYADAADRYPTVELDEVRTLGPQLVLLPSEPYPFAERHRHGDIATVATDIRLVDGQDLFWWGVRTHGAVARLRDALG